MTPIVTGVPVPPSGPSIPLGGQTLAELLTEFYARGFDYLKDDAEGVVRATRWLNEAYLELCELEDWPFVENTATTNAPITFTNLRQVLSVVDTTSLLPIRHEDRRTLVQSFIDLSATGSATWWYLEGDTLRVFPVSTDSLSVRFLYVPGALVDAGDTLVVPNRFQYLIIDGAVIKGYKDSDKFDQIIKLRMEYDRGVDTMRDALLTRNYDYPDRVVSTDRSFDAGYYYH